MAAETAEALLPSNNINNNMNTSTHGGPYSQENLLQKTSDYRSLLTDCINQTNNCIKPSPQNNVTPNNRTYAHAASHDTFPKKDQAIVIESKNDITIKEYVTALGTIVKPNAIRFVSRISNNRICIFMASKEIADNITQKYNSLTVRDTQVELRPLLNKHKRIVLSKVCPIIPHYIIEEYLKKLKIKK